MSIKYLQKFFKICTWTVSPMLIYELFKWQEYLIFNHHVLVRWLWEKPKRTVKTLISGKVREGLHFLCIVCHKFVVLGQFRNKRVVVSSEIPHRLYMGYSARPICEVFGLKTKYCTVFIAEKLLSLSPKKLSSAEYIIVTSPVTLGFIELPLKLALACWFNNSVLDQAIIDLSACYRFKSLQAFMNEKIWCYTIKNFLGTLAFYNLYSPVFWYRVYQSIPS